MSYSVPDKEALATVWDVIKSRSIPLKPLTQAEYDVLDETQKYADICYLVSANAHAAEPVEPGAPSSMKLIYKNEVLGESSSQDAGENYSTEETRIGTWIDGKPLYRRVIEGITPSSSGSSNSVANFGSSIRFVHYYGIVHLNNSTRLVAPNRAGSEYIGLYASNESSISCITTWSSALSKPIFVVGEYTKTTD